MAKEKTTKNGGTPAEGHSRARLPIGIRVLTWPVVGAYRLITLPFLRMAYMHYGSIEDTAQRRKKARALRNKLVLFAYALLFVWAHLGGLYYIFWGVLLVDVFKFIVGLFVERLTPDGYRSSDGRPIRFHSDYVDHQQELNDAYWRGFNDSWW